MVKFTTTILKFDEQGEKTGWTYVEVPAEIAQQLKPNNKQSFRVKGFLDVLAIKQVALVPMGEGAFILPINATMRKGIGKRKGASLKLQLDLDDSPIEISPELLDCLADEPKALAYFNKLPKSHQNYYSRWIEGAKTAPTKAKRIIQAINACSKEMHYGEMIRSLKAENQSKF